jgi:hypothetical protein
MVMAGNEITTEAANTMLRDAGNGNPNVTKSDLSAIAMKFLQDRDPHYLQNEIEAKIKAKTAANFSDEEKDSIKNDIAALINHPNFQTLGAGDYERLRGDIAQLRQMGVQLSPADEAMLGEAERQVEEKKAQDAKDIQNAAGDLIGMVAGASVAGASVAGAGAGGLFAALKGGSNNSDSTGDYTTTNATSGGSGNDNSANSSAAAHDKLTDKDAIIAQKEAAGAAKGEGHTGEIAVDVALTSLAALAPGSSGAPTIDGKAPVVDASVPEAGLDSKSLAELKLEAIAAAKLAITEHLGWANVTPNDLKIATEIAVERVEAIGKDSPNADVLIQKSNIQDFIDTIKDKTSDLHKDVIHDFTEKKAAEQAISITLTPAKDIAAPTVTKSGGNPEMDKLLAGFKAPAGVALAAGNVDVANLGNFALQGGLPNKGPQKGGGLGIAS